MSIFRRNKKKSGAEEASVEDVQRTERVRLPDSVVQSIPKDQRGGPVEKLRDGRYIIVGRNILMVADEERVVDSGFWHEVQYCAWDAASRRFLLVWSQPERDRVEGVTVTNDPEDLMRKITLRVDSTIVATRRFVTSTGVSVVATVRRRVDGELFSAVFVGGTISEADQEKAFGLEQSLRDELGLSD